VAIETGSKPHAGPRPVRALAVGAHLQGFGGRKPPLRMLMNNLDPEVAERPDDLVVYGGTGRGGSKLDAFDAIVRELSGPRERRNGAFYFQKSPI